MMAISVTDVRKNWRDLKRFCEMDGNYMKILITIFYEIYENGNLRFTKVSRGTGEIKGFLWKEIFKKQLGVAEEYFNNKL